MKSLPEILKIIDKQKETLEKKFSVSRIGIFGSYSKSYSTEGSDIDILVEFSEKVDIFHFLKLENYLTDILSIKVDLVTFNALRKEIKEDILREVVYA